MSSDELYMQRCLNLAILGLGKVSPNPMVGCVIVYENRIIGEGFHEKYGEAHAEVNAINSVTEKHLLKEATIYVSLEPCAHFGKTPPCADLLVQHDFKRVVIGTIDPFAKVNGTGIEKLKKAGIEVSIGVLVNECKKLNKRFFTFHEKNRPYIILKWAQSKDGFIDAQRIDNFQKATKISCEESNVLVHQWRSEEDAILVGKNTVLNDNPSLTVRKIAGKNPTRIVLDSNLETINADRSIFNKEAETIVFNTHKNDVQENITFMKIESMDLKLVLSKLKDLNISSLIVEGGAKVLQSFIDAKLYDEIRVIRNKEFLYSGVAAPILNLLPGAIQENFTDEILYY